MSSANPVPVQVSRLHEKLSAILTISQQMNSERDLGTLLDLVAREATRLLNADRASIFLLDRENLELWSKVALGSDEILRFDARRGIAGSAALTGKVINVSEAYKDERFNSAIDSQTGYHTRNLLAVPLQNLIDGEVVGAFEVLNKRHGDFDAEDEEVLKSLAAQSAIAIQTARSIGELTKENAHLWHEVEGRYARHSIIGNSSKIQSVLHLIERIRDSSVNVLISGESGTGKDLIARALHYSSPRARRPLVALNCAALPETLVETELFGIEKGVATGVNSRMGQFQAADGGTLFLDEIADLSLAAQAKILRVLEAKVVDRVGGRASIPVDVRVLAASNKDLEAEIRKGRFREDLYYRLNVIHIRMPSLREIREDIPLLAHHFLAECCRDSGKQLEISPGVLRRMVEREWPGNVRQLQNEIKRLVACARKRIISEEDLAEGIPEVIERKHPAVSGAASIKDAVEDLERRMIADTLRSTGNNQQRAAKALGISRQGLINKMKRYKVVS
ncbi:MAG TPA: sigma 54-interacting transcriptional regulator [Bryobacteraceae bacterium]|nr:sigma 54-interacting transcriptional regulator [Bryobacteraceae bacterium]